MAKAAATSTNKVVPISPDALMPAFLADRVKVDAGKGVSSSQADNIVPLIYILQALSPQVNPRNPDYVEGAEPGDIYLRGTPSPLVKGNEGLTFQPCYFSKDWVEWVPRQRGGGYVGRHADCPADAQRTEVQGDGGPQVRWMRPNGNEVIETRYHVGYAITESMAPMPFVIPMTSSAHTISRQWMFAMNAKRMGRSGVAPSWAGLYLLKTKERSKNNRSWMTWDITDAGWVTTSEEYDRGAALHDSFAQGEKIVDAPDTVPQHHVDVDENTPM